MKKKKKKKPKQLTCNIYLLNETKLCQFLNKEIKFHYLDMNFPLGGILLFYYILLNLPFVASQKRKKKKRWMKMFETTVEIFSLVLLCFSLDLWVSLVQVSSREPNSNRSNHKMTWLEGSLERTSWSRDQQPQSLWPTHSCIHFTEKYLSRVVQLFESGVPRPWWAGVRGEEQAGYWRMNGPM